MWSGDLSIAVELTGNADPGPRPGLPGNQSLLVNQIPEGFPYIQACSVRENCSCETDKLQREKTLMDRRKRTG